jgi:hypothetical protein
MVASERFRLVHGRWPDSIEMLVPRLLPELPVDPFMARNPVVRKLTDSLAVYSVGSDQTDNGGTFERRGWDKPGYDLGYRLWDKEARRRPPEQGDRPEAVFAKDSR